MNFFSKFFVRIACPLLVITFSGLIVAIRVFGKRFLGQESCFGPWSSSWNLDQTRILWNTDYL